MLRVSSSRLVHATPEEVWTRLEDVTTHVDWVSGVTSVERSDGLADVGTTHDQVNPVVGPWKAHARWEVVDVEEHRRLVLVSHDLPMCREFRAVHALAPEGPATRFTLTLEMDGRLGPLNWLLGRATRPLLRQAAEQTTLGLSEQFEQEEPPQAAEA